MGFTAREAGAFCQGFSALPGARLSAEAADYHRMRKALQASASGEEVGGDPQLTALLAQVRTIIARGGAPRWLSRTREDANPDKLGELPGVSWERNSRVLELLREDRVRPARKWHRGIGARAEERSAA